MGLVQAIPSPPRQAWWLFGAQTPRAPEGASVPPGSHREGQLWTLGSPGWSPSGWEAEGGKVALGLFALRFLSQRKTHYAQAGMVWARGAGLPGRGHGDGSGALYAGPAQCWTPPANFHPSSGLFLVTLT